MIESELAQRIENAIEALPRERKRIFKMSRYEGLKYREIAEELDISQKTVENQMGKALRFLKEQLIEYLPLIGMGVYFWFNNFNYE
jgi:RNA polymerase sigma-70 factor (ECF subfamily)